MYCILLQVNIFNYLHDYSFLQIIITHLKVEQDSLETLRNTGALERPATIQYSRPYDYLKKEDRKEIVEILLWIGYMQANSDT